MEIHRKKENQALVIELHGRLDAAWCPVVEQACSEAIRSGEHRIHLDLAGVDYISSAGLRILITIHRKLSAIHGELRICRPSKEVVSIFELCGLWQIFSQVIQSAPEETESSRHTSPSAEWVVYDLACANPARVVRIGAATAWEAAVGTLTEFPGDSIGLGVGAFADSRESASPRLGEFLAVAGCAAQLPPGNSMRPDFLIVQERLIPKLWITSGLVARGGFSRLLRFESTEHSRTTSLAEVAEFALGDAPAAVMVMMAETSGLIGANLQQAPDTFVENPFAFPEIRNRLGFTSERAFRDGTSLIVGFVARPGTELDAWLRPIGNELLGHLHAAAFPYRPLQKGKVDLNTTVSAFFESQTLQSVLHLINDTRAPGGAGDSEFYRGACWVSPLSL